MVRRDRASDSPAAGPTYVVMRPNVGAHAVASVFSDHSDGHLNPRARDGPRSDKVRFGRREPRRDPGNTNLSSIRRATGAPDGPRRAPPTTTRGPTHAPQFSDAPISRPTTGGRCDPIRAALPATDSRPDLQCRRFSDDARKPIFSGISFPFSIRSGIIQRHGADARDVRRAAGGSDI